MQILRIVPALLLCSALSHAGTITQTGSGGIVQDNTPSGTQFDITILSAEVIALTGLSNVTVSINNFSHPNVGEVALELTNIPNSPVTIFNRPGVPVPGPFPSDLNGTYAFSSGFSASFENAANGLDTDIVPPGDYLPEDDMAAAFNGKLAGGTWRLTVFDLAPLNLANADWTWTLTIQTVGDQAAVPEPATWMLMAGALSALLLRRRLTRRFQDTGGLAKIRNRTRRTSEALTGTT